MNNTITDWKDAEVTANANRKVETRTVYRYYVPETGSGHVWDTGVVTRPATETEAGVRTYTCTVCGEVRTEPIPPVDPNAPTILVGSVSAVPGATVSVDVSLKNNPGINTFVLGFNYDTARLTLKNVAVNPALGGQFQYKNKAVWLNGSDTTYNGVILTLTFEVSENAAEGDAEIAVTYDAGDIADYDENDVLFERSSGKVSIVKSVKPATPVNVKAAASATGAVTVSWDPAAGATVYHVHRYKGNTKKYEYIGETDATEYQATGLSAGTTYYFKVLAVNNESGTPYYSAYSSAVSAMAKEYLTAEGVTLHAVKFPYDGAQHIPAVTVKNAAGKTLSVGTDYTVTYPAGMTEIGTYTYRIKGTGKYAGSVSKSFTIVPAAVTGVSAAPSAAGKITVSWSKANGATLYYVFRYKGDTKKYEYVGGTSGTSYTVSGLNGGTTYYFKVLSLTKIGEKTVYGAAYSQVVTAKCLTVPAVPKTVQAAATAANEITVSWTASANATQYNVYRYNSTKKAYVYIGTSKTLSYAAGGLTNGTTYYFKVVPVTKESGLTLVGAYSAAVNAKCVGEPAAPTGLTATASGPASVTLTWKTVAAAAEYTVYRYNGTLKKYIEVGNTTEKTFTVTGLVAGTTYYFKVAAVSVGSGLRFTGEKSEAVSQACSKIPEAPTGLKAVASAPNAITLSWNASALATQYGVYRYNGTKKEYVLVGTTDSANYTVNGLVAGVTYYFKVMSINQTTSETLSSALSAAVSAKVLGVPAAPKGLTAAAAPDGIALGWTAVTGATQYNLYRSASAGGSYKYIGTAKAESYTDTGVASGSTYYYKAVAVMKGNGMTFVSDYSAAVGATAE